MARKDKNTHINVDLSNLTPNLSNTGGHEFLTPIIDESNTKQNQNISRPAFLSIKVKTMKGEEHLILARAEYTILMVKKMLESYTGTPPDQQRLLFGGKQLEDEKTVGS